MGHAAAAFDEGILVVGGRNRNQLRDAIDYVPFDGTATRLSSRLLEPVGEPAVVSLAGRVYIVGGLTKGRISGGVSRFPF